MLEEKSTNFSKPLKYYFYPKFVFSIAIYVHLHGFLIFSRDLLGVRVLRLLSKLLILKHKGQFLPLNYVWLWLLNVQWCKSPVAFISWLAPVVAVLHCKSKLLNKFSRKLYQHSVNWQEWPSLSVLSLSLQQNIEILNQLSQIIPGQGIYILARNHYFS